MSLNSPGKKETLKESRVKFVIFAKIALLESFVVSHNVVSEGV